MQKTISATEARNHFSEVLQLVKNGPFVIERHGKPFAVILSKSDYDRLTAGENQINWMSLLEETHWRVHAEREGKPIPSPEDILNDLRGKRNASFNHLR